MRAFSFVKGSEAHYKQVHLSLVRQAGYDIAFTAVSGSRQPAGHSSRRREPRLACNVAFMSILYW